MRFIGSVIEKLQRHPKRIVFPEGVEPRVLQAARQFYSLRLGAPILLGDRTKIKEVAEALNISLGGIRIINPAESEELLDHLCRQADVPEYQLRFHWEPGSIAFWDNVAVQHYGVNDYFPQRRTMARGTFFGSPDAWPGAGSAARVTSRVGE